MALDAPYHALMRGPAREPARAAGHAAHVYIEPPCDAHARVRIALTAAGKATTLDLNPAEARALAHALLSACDVPDAS